MPISKTLAAFSLGALLLAPGLAQANTHLQAARKQLLKARAELSKDGKSYDGHREKALEHVREALDEVNAARGVSGSSKLKP